MLYIYQNENGANSPKTSQKLVDLFATWREQRRIIISMTDFENGFMKPEFLVRNNIITLEAITSRNVIHAIQQAPRGTIIVCSNLEALVNIETGVSTPTYEAISLVIKEIKELSVERGVEVHLFIQRLTIIMKTYADYIEQLYFEGNIIIKNRFGFTTEQLRQTAPF